MHSQSALRQQTQEDQPLNFIVTMRPVYKANYEVAAFDPVIQSLNPDSPVSVNDIEALGIIVSETYGKISKSGSTKTVPCFLKLTSAILGDLNLPDFSSDQYIFEFTPDLKSFSSQDDMEEEFNCFTNFLDNGYRMAVSLNRDNIQHINKFLPLVQILKLDMSKPNHKLAAALLEKLEGRDIELFATNLTSKADYEKCQQIGFKYFSGEIFGEPDGSNKKKLGHNKSVLMNALTALQNPNSSNEDVADAIQVDAKLTYKLLKIVNSAGVGLSLEISSISQAIQVLGFDQLRRWISLFLLDKSDGRSSEIMRNSLIRARMCELLAALSRKDLSFCYFMVGLLSQLDLMTDIQMAELVVEMPLSDDIKEALVSRKGEIGGVLSEVEHYLEGDFEHMQWLTNASHYETCYRHSVIWATNIQGSMAG